MFCKVDIDENDASELFCADAKYFLGRRGIAGVHDQSDAILYLQAGPENYSRFWSEHAIYQPVAEDLAYVCQDFSDLMAGGYLFSFISAVARDGSGSPSRSNSGTWVDYEISAACKAAEGDLAAAFCTSIPDDDSTTVDSVPELQLDWDSTSIGITPPTSL